MTRSIRILIATIIIFSIQGCASLSPRESSSRDLSELLTPIKDSLVATEKKPLVFPTTVAILMVPGNNKNSYNEMVPASTLRIAAEELKKTLLKSNKYINGVSIISAGDILEKISLDTIRNLYGVDIVFILSYQQDQRSDQNVFGQLLNVYIVPAFVLPSVKVTTSTIVDGKIIHIPSNAIIFRSSGVDERSTYMTPVSSNQKNAANEQSIKGFLAAVNQFGDNVSKRLEGFTEFDMAKAVSMSNILTEKADAKAASTPSGEKPEATPPKDTWSKVDNYKSSGGGGSFGFLEVFFLGLMVVFLRFGLKRS
jgi:rhombotail lipoprotein